MCCDLHGGVSGIDACQSITTRGEIESSAKGHKYPQVGVDHRDDPG